MERTMIAFEVSDMTCGHCVSTITNVLKGVDRDAKVRFDLAKHRIEIEASSAEASRTWGEAPLQVAATAARSLIAAIVPRSPPLRVQLSRLAL
jgi:copper chaperone CopZ